MILCIEVNYIIYKNYDEDDEELSKLRLTTIKRAGELYVPDVLTYHESELNKKYLDIIFHNGIIMTIDYPREDFKKLFAGYKEFQFQLDHTVDSQTQNG